MEHVRAYHASTVALSAMMTVNASTQYLLWSALPEVGAFSESIHQPALSRPLTCSTVEFSFHIAAASRLL